MVPVLRSAACPSQLGRVLARRQSFIEISNYFRGRGALRLSHLKCTLQGASRFYSTEKTNETAKLLGQYSKSSENLSLHQCEDGDSCAKNVC